MIKVKNKEQCCGCGACIACCPQSAVIFKEDIEGFSYPTVESDKCIECGLCEKVCPIKQRYENNYSGKSYAAYTKEASSRKNSSSGGIFGVIASAVLKNGGVVCGAAFNDDFTVSHIIIDNIEDLHRLQGSKYVQSYINGIFIEIKEVLEAGKIVLFSGTACQVAGLKKYLRKEYNNLISIDVLCHGVPSPKLWEKYIRELKVEHGKEIKNINFRNKEDGWKAFSFLVEFEDKIIKRENFVNNNYMKLFLSNICLRPSCHACKYKGLDRPSDLTIGDFWGVEKMLPDMDDDMGTSIVKINSLKGEKIFRKLSNQLNYREVDIDVALPENADSRKSVKPHEKRDMFFTQLSRKSINQLVKLLQPSLFLRVKRKIKRMRFPTF